MTGGGHAAVAEKGLGLRSLYLSYFGSRLKAVRKERGLTQAQLADQSGIVQPHISKLERGAWEPQLSTIMALADALEVQLVDLCPTSEWCREARLKEAALKDRG